MKQKLKLTGLLSVLLVLSILVIPLVSAKEVGISSQWLVNGQPQADNTLIAQKGQTVEYLVSASGTEDYNLIISLLDTNTQQKIKDLWAVNYLYGNYNKKLSYTLTTDQDLIILSRAYNAASDDTSVLYLVVDKQVCEDADGDGICDEDDACLISPEDFDGYQDEDGCPEENPCADADSDGVCDANDNCIDTPNANQANADNDALGDVCDKCPEVAGPEANDGCYVYTNFPTPKISEEDLNLYANLPEITLPVENNAPGMIDIPDYSVTETNTLIFTVFGKDKESSEITYEASTCKEGLLCALLKYFGMNLPIGASFNGENGQFTFTPDFEFVKHPELQNDAILWFRAYDGELYSEWESSKITVLDRNQIPEITLVDAPEKIYAGEEAVFFAEAQDADGDTLAYSWSFNNSGTAITGQNQTYTFAVPGEYLIKLAVVDGYGGEDTEEFIIKVEPQLPIDIFGCTDSTAMNFNEEATVDDGSCVYAIPGCMDPTALNYNPEANVDDESCVYATEAELAIISAPPTIATVGEEYTYCVKVKSTSDELTYSLLKDPEGMIIDVDGCISWIPEDDDDAFVTISVTNGKLTATQIYKITVRDVFTGLKLAKAHLANEVVAAGDYAVFGIKVSNYGGKDMDDMKVTLISYDLGFKKSSTEFNLDGGDSKSLQMVIEVPAETMPGEYLVEIWAGNEHYHDASYRQIVVE